MEPAVVNEWTPEDIARKLCELDNWSIYCHAKRRAGKTHLLTHILYHINEIEKERPFDIVALFSNTAANMDQWRMITPGFRHHAYRPEAVEAVIDLQEERMKHNNAAEEIDKEPVPRILVILDDCMSDRHVAHDEALEALYTRGRHMNISVCTIVQDKKGAPPRLRGNSDLLLSFRSLSMHDRKDLIESYLAVVGTGRDAFRRGVQYYEDVFADHKHAALAILLSESAGARDVSDYSGRVVAPAESPPDFRMGRESFWNKKSHGTTIVSDTPTRLMEPA